MDKSLKNENVADAKAGEKLISEEPVMDRRAFMQTSILSAAATVTTPSHNFLADTNSRGGA